MANAYRGHRSNVVPLDLVLVVSYVCVTLASVSESDEVGAFVVRQLLLSLRQCMGVPRAHQCREFPMIQASLHIAAELLFENSISDRTMPDLVFAMFLCAALGPDAEMHRLVKEVLATLLRAGGLRAQQEVAR